jgi:hypothetical protein
MDKDDLELVAFGQRPGDRTLWGMRKLLTKLSVSGCTTSSKTSSPSKVREKAPTPARPIRHTPVVLARNRAATSTVAPWMGLSPTQASQPTARCSARSRLPSGPGSARRTLGCRTVGR